jgi:hypothetical protein
MRFSSPRAPISRPRWDELRRRLTEHRDRYERLGDYALYAGVIAVFAIATYLLVTGG